MREFVNAFYFNRLNAIGGVESWLNYIAELYGKYDITVLFRGADEEQLRRLRKKARCVQWDGKERFKCNVLFVNYNPEIINYVEADEVIYMVHSDYTAMAKLNILSTDYAKAIAGNPNITKYLAVSQWAQQSFYEASGVMPEVCYNPIALSKPQKLVRLVSAQRMSKEKGGKRIEQLARALDAYCIRTGAMYQWDIYTNGSMNITSPNVGVRAPQVEVNRIFGSYDYFVALSDNEAFCYSVAEALMRGTPVVVTPCPVFKEIGVNKDNSIQLAFDCSNADQVAEDIFTKQFSFSYTPPKSAIGKYLKKKKTTYEYKGMLVKAVRPFVDLQENRTVQLGEVFEVEKTRGDELIEKGLVMKGD